MRIDAHAHSGHYFNFYIPEVTAEDMIKSMDNCNIDISCITPNFGLTDNVSKGNDEVLRIVNKYPNRFKGYVCINPYYPEDMKKDLNRCIDNENILGGKIHHTCHRSSIAHKDYEYSYGFLNERKAVLLYHCFDMETIKEIERVSKKYKDMSIILGHFGAYPDNMEYCCNMINNSENLYGDTCISMIREGNVEWLTSLVTSKKVLFGTDLPFLDPRVNVGRIKYADLKQEEIDDIFGNNMQRIIERIEK